MRSPEERRATPADHPNGPRCVDGCCGFAVALLVHRLRHESRRQKVTCWVGQALTMAVVASRGPWVAVTQEVLDVPEADAGVKGGGASSVSSEMWMYWP